MGPIFKTALREMVRFYGKTMSVPNFISIYLKCWNKSLLKIVFLIGENLVENICECLSRLFDKF